MIHTLLLIVFPLLCDTAATSIYVQGDYSGATQMLSGKWDAGFAVHAESVYDFQPKQSKRTQRLFGEAYYSWNQSRGNIFVENADYTLLYPYLTTDTAGGGLHTETYYFHGGYTFNPLPLTSKTSSFTFTIAMSYRALQSYRSVDPRPNNKVADLTIDGSVGYASKKYIYSLLLSGGRYKQNNDIAFYSELGESMLYHMAFPGQDYARFSGSNKSAYYRGAHVALGLQIQPRQTGWFAQFDYQWHTVQKELNMQIALPIVRLHQHNIVGKIAYITPIWRVAFTTDVNFRRGSVFVYGEAKNNAYELLTLLPNYAENVYRLGLDGQYHLVLPVGKMLFQGAFSGKINQVADCPIAPRFADLAAILTSSTVDAQAAIRYTFPIHKKIDFFLQPTAQYTHYLAPNQYRYQLNFKIGIIF